MVVLGRKASFRRPAGSHKHDIAFFYTGCPRLQFLLPDGGAGVNPLQLHQMRMTDKRFQGNFVYRYAVREKMIRGIQMSPGMGIYVDPFCDETIV